VRPLCVERRAELCLSSEIETFYTLTGNNEAFELSLEKLSMHCNLERTCANSRFIACSERD
jgi:hypothetical protein